MTTYVQIGTYRGNDDFMEEVKNQPDALIILVEPQPSCIKDIEIAYDGFKNVHVENIAIHPDPGKLTLDLHVAHVITSFDINHIRKHKGQESQGVITVPCLTANQLLLKYGVSEVDLLYIDAEGLDEEIIYSIDFDTFRIRRLVYEHLHMDRKAVQEYLVSLGFEIKRNYDDLGYNDEATLVA